MDSGRLRDQLLIDGGERSKYINDLIRMLSTQGASNRNSAMDRATRAGASEGSKNAMESNLAYQTGKVTEEGISGINKDVDSQNRAAAEYLGALQERQDTQRSNMWSGIAGGIGTLAGNFLGGPAGGMLANMIMPDQKPVNALPTMPKFDFSTFSNKTPNLGQFWANKQNQFSRQNSSYN